jgi:hypothetical protein
MSDHTHSVVLRLDPSLMDNPALEVRGELESMVRTASPGLAFDDDGYGFAKSSDAMLLSYATSEPDRLVEEIVNVLARTRVLGNDLAPAAMVAVARRNAAVVAGEEFADHRVVYPAHDAGKPLPD